METLGEHSAASLEVPFIEDDVWDAVRRWDGNKFPGPDGFNLAFFSIGLLLKLILWRYFTTSTIAECYLRI
ncbi:hypothetical protein J1N35_011419 [Gossypium stocksii]|uniref:Uncharacterized protein n=1 Tax=Gossypium stocksii TaxID=47602 RepID=A0A9D3W2A8_9ROSI|nr:hypothetical protein J1N35_011419 [Gossypium stocksii]